MVENPSNKVGDRILIKQKNGLIPATVRFRGSLEDKNGEWVGAPPIEDTFVINIGNIMETWSNGFFSSTPHRVINCGGQDRYSIPLFVQNCSSSMSL